MAKDDKTCGDYGGRNKNNKPCGYPAGYGTNRSHGRCYIHEDQQPDTDEVWTCPDEYRNSPNMMGLWDMVSGFCRDHSLLESTHFLIARGILDNYYLKKQSFKEMIQDGITAVDRAHGKQKKKHPASITYFKAQNAMVKNIKELIREAKRDKGVDDEEIEDDPMYQFFQNNKK